MKDTYQRILDKAAADRAARKEAQNTQRGKAAKQYRGSTEDLDEDQLAALAELEVCTDLKEAEFQLATDLNPYNFLGAVEEIDTQVFTCS